MDPFLLEVSNTAVPMRIELGKEKKNPNPNPLSIMQAVLDRCSVNPWPCRQQTQRRLVESKIDTLQKIDTRQSIWRIHRVVSQSSPLNFGRQEEAMH